MAIVPMDNAHALQMLQNDALQLRSFIQWANARYQAYNQNLSTPTQQSNAGFSVAADQNSITAFIGDLNRIVQLTSGTLPTTATNMSFDVQLILGFM